MNRFEKFVFVLALVAGSLVGLTAHGAPLAERLTTIAVEAPKPWHRSGHEEPANERASRLAVIAQAIAETAAAPPPGWRWGADELAAVLLATTYEEGWRWRRDVHEGEKLGDHGRARCLAQLWRHPTWMPRELWLASTGTDYESTRICVDGAARVLAHYSETCVSPWRAASDLEGALARVVMGYGTGARCSPAPWAQKRARLAVRWLGEIRK